MSDHGWVLVEWLDGRVESHFGKVRILDGGVLEIYEVSAITAAETVRISVPMAGLRKWVPMDRA